MVLLGDEAHVVLVSAHFVIVLIFTQDSCSVCAKHTIGTEIILDTPDGTLR
jgi:hypothetical protein